MTGERTQGQDVPMACELFVDWLDLQVTQEARGDFLTELDVDPSATLWLGRLAGEASVAANPLGERAERLDPCAVGMRLRPVAPGPWSLTVTASACAWAKDTGEKGVPTLWRKSDPVEETMTMIVAAAGATIRPALVAGLSAVGASALAAEVRVTVESQEDQTELVVELVNTTPAAVRGAYDEHLYEASLSVTGLATRPFLLEALPDSFRYDRLMPALGINAGVAVSGSGDAAVFATTDTAVVQTRRPAYWNSPQPPPNLTFRTLADNPIPQLSALVDALAAWNAEHWSDDAARERAAAQGWTERMVTEFREARAEAEAEEQRLRDGLVLLTDDANVRQAFRLMNRAIAYSSAGRGYDGWRPFQIGFLLGCLRFLSDPTLARETVDTVWFATGGGKTETYLGLLVTAAFHDRLTGKTSGLTAWARFPLRLLSLQQTQRFADALAGAERVRREDGVTGAPFSLGFLVGRSSTPNRIVKDSATEEYGNPDPESPGMPGSYQVLLRCPFCQGDAIRMKFDRRHWRLGHRCENVDCPWPEDFLPVYVVDEEIYRFLPTVVLGTLDKAASIAIQASMRGLVGPPSGLCSEEGHGYTYAVRAKRPHGCLVPDCHGTRRTLPMRPDLYAPRLRLQDELHLLRDSLGAVDSHYESLLDHLQTELGAPQAKVVASSATLSGHDRQVRELYRRRGRVFPLQGPRADESFWSGRTAAPLRRFVAVAPRGVTLEHVSDRTINILQKAVRRLQSEPAVVCEAAGIDPVHADKLIDLYGTDVVYGTTLHEVEAAERSLATNSDLAVNSVQLTGSTDFDDVRSILERLEKPETDFADRIQVVAASSMLSHGVDVARLNVMVMLGLPLGTAEFIQTSARVGRTYPGLVYVLHKIARERDAATFRQFPHFVTHGDRFVDPVPITRRSRRVLRKTMPGLMEARRLMLMEPRAGNLATLRALRDYVRQSQLTPADQAQAIARALGFDDGDSAMLVQEIAAWLEGWFTTLLDPATTAKWPSDLSPDRPMLSLRDVESSVPVWE